MTKKNKCIKKVYAYEQTDGRDPIFIKVDENNKSAPYTQNFKQDLIKSLIYSKESDSQSLSTDSTNVTNFYNYTDPPYNPEQLALLLTLNSTHYRCCKIKSTDITAQGYSLPINPSFNIGEEEFTEAEQDVIDNQKMQVNKLLNKLEDGLGQEELINKIGLDYESIGYFGCEVLRNTLGEIINVKHVPAKSIRVTSIKGKVVYYYQVVDEKKVIFVPYGQKFTFEVPDHDEDIYTNKVLAHMDRKVSNIRLVRLESNSEIKEDNLELNGRDVTVEEKDDFKKSANELLFVTQSHPATSIYGVPEVIPALASINGNISIEDFLNQFFENNAIPQYMLIIEGTDEVEDEVVTTVTKFFRDNIKGSNHSTLIFPVPEGVKVEVKALATEVREGSYQVTRLNNRDNILIAHGMTPAQIGIIDVANLGSGSGLSQAENYKNRVLGPRQRMYENRLINSLIGEYGQGLLAVVLKYNSLDISDKELLRKKHETYLDKGVMSINEVRNEIGLEDILGGEKAFLVLSNEVVLLEDIERRLREAEKFDNSLTNELRKTMNRVLNK